MKKRIACLLSFLLSLYTCTALARHQQLMHNVYDTQESQSKVNEILSAVSFHGNELSYGERIAEISSRFLGTPYPFPRNALSGAYTYWIIFDAREAGH